MKKNFISNFVFSTKEIFKIDKKYILLKIIEVFLNSIKGLTFAYLLKEVIEMIENKIEFKDIVFETIIISIVIFSIHYISKIINNFFIYEIPKITLQLKNKFAIKVLKIDYQFLEKPKNQDTLKKITNALDGGSILGIVNVGFASLSYLITSILTLGIIVYVKWWLIIVVVILLICKIILENKEQKFQKEKFYDIQPPIQRRIDYTNSISTNTSIGKDLRIYKLNKFIDCERDAAINDYLSLYKNLKKKEIVYYTFLQILEFLDKAVLYISFGFDVIYKSMEISSFTFYTTSVSKLTSSLYYLISNNAELLRLSIEVKEYREFISFIENENKAEFDFDTNDLEVEFKNVYYSYYMQDDFALENISFKINKGEKIALVGYNGAGKTTLVKLLCGLYHPTKGEILINGVNIENISRETLAKLISPVFQESYMFALSLLENVGMNTIDEIDVEKVNDIMKIIDFEKKLNALPNGLNTFLNREFDENGIELSGGETQKLSLARAIYKESALYILDEPTSAFDAINEYNMYNNFNEIVKGKSTIFISHRLASAKFCDRIIFLEKGKICEIGTHDELMKNKNKYKRLFDMQAQYYKDGEENEKN